MNFEDMKKEITYYDAASTAKIEAKNFIIPGFPQGVVGALVASGGVGKSFYTLQLCVNIALGKDKHKQGKILYLPAEDPQDEIFSHIQAINMSFDLSPAEIEEVKKRFFIIKCLGYNVNLLNSQEKFGQDIVTMCESLEKYGDDEKAHGKISLIIYDTFRRFHLGNENDAAEMSKMLSALERVTEKTGAACLFLHHTNKTSGLNSAVSAQQASRGSSVLVDNIRFQCFMQSMSEAESNSLCDMGTEPIGDDDRKHYVRWGVSKINYGARPDDQWYRRNDFGVLEKVTLKKGS